jgi:hypothetical protein
MTYSQNVVQTDASGNQLIADGSCLMSVIDLSGDTATTIVGPAVLLGVHVDVVMSAHAVTIGDAAVTKITLAASTAAGTNLDFHSALFSTSIVVTPNVSSTGTITVFYRLV